MSQEDSSDFSGKAIGYIVMFFLAIWLIGFVLVGFLAAVIFCLIYYGIMWLHHYLSESKEQGKQAHFDKMLQKSYYLSWEKSRSIVSIINLNRDLTWFMLDKDGHRLKEFEKGEPEIQDVFFRKHLWYVLGISLGLIFLVIFYLSLNPLYEVGTGNKYTGPAFVFPFLFFNLSFIISLYLIMTEYLKETLKEHYARSSFYEGYYFRELDRRLLPLKQDIDKAVKAISLGEELAEIYDDKKDIQAALTMRKHIDEAVKLVRHALIAYLLKTSTQEQTEEDLRLALHCVISGRAEEYSQNKNEGTAFQKACETLGIDINATLKEAKKAHRTLAKRAHTDIIGGDGALMKSINVAFDIFKAEKRV